MERPVFSDMKRTATKSRINLVIAKSAFRQNCIPPLSKAIIHVSTIIVTEVRPIPIPNRSILGRLAPIGSKFFEIIGVSRAKITPTVVPTRPTRISAALIIEPSCPLLRGNSLINRVLKPNKQMLESSIIVEVAAEAKPTAGTGKSLSATNQYANPSPDVINIVPISDAVFINMTLLLFTH
jgi:hypothetical protein